NQGGFGLGGWLGTTAVALQKPRTPPTWLPGTPLLAAGRQEATAAPPRTGSGRLRATEIPSVTPRGRRGTCRGMLGREHPTRTGHVRPAAGGRLRPGRAGP